MKNSEKKTTRSSAFKALIKTILLVIGVIALVYFLRDQPWLPKEIGEHLWFKSISLMLLALVLERGEIKRLITGKEKKLTRF